MQESITIAIIGIRCIHMRTSCALKLISEKYNVVIELANIQKADNNHYVKTDDPLELMLLALKKGDVCKIKVVGETGLASPATNDVLDILEAKAIQAA
jgi:phosphotransferase system HPr-like phosphotransfer protein